VTTVLITGSTGHVGRELARRARSGGMSVRALVRSDAQARTVELYGWVPVRGDLTQPLDLTSALDGVDVVLHCAAYGGPDLALARAVNVEGTRALARGSLQAGVRRFVHLSTVSVHGEPLPTGRLDEESPLATTDKEPYCATKALGELALGEARAAGLQTVVLRPGMICNVLRSQWGNELVERLRTRGWPKDLHPGDVLPWVHTSNLAEMTWLALTHPSAANETFLAVDRNVTMGEFFGPIASALGIPIDAPDREPLVSLCNLGKIAEALGYAPLHAFEETLDVLVRMAAASR
jgi:nucleoside-diphosphate-sugar epimerase